MYVSRERQATIHSHYTEMDWRKKSEEVRKERMRRVQEWERNHAGKNKGEKRTERKISFNVVVSEDFKKLNESEREVSSISNMIMHNRTSTDNVGSRNKLKGLKMNRSKSESSLQIDNVDQFKEMLPDRKSVSIDVLSCV